MKYVNSKFSNIGTMCDACEQVDREFEGKTALHHAAFSGHTDVIKTLLEFGADKDITVSILLYTCQHGFFN